MSFALLYVAPLPQQLSQQNVLDLILNAGWVAKGVVLLLGVFSLISWAIIFAKLGSFRKLGKESKRFMTLFEQRRSVREIFQASRQYTSNPFAAVFREAYYMLNKSDGTRSGAPQLTETKNRKIPASSELVRLFDAVAGREIMHLEKYLIFLATTSSVSPFLGLFGTVWGVMSAFLAVGNTGSADLSVVAPGIAEALITTLVGLAAAIPAAMFYNHFVSRLKRLSGELEIFYSNLIEALSRTETHEVR